MMEKQLSSIEHSRNVPKLRFSDFKDSWDYIDLGKATTINPKNPQLPDSFIYVDLESVNKGSLTKEDRLIKEGAPSRAQRLLKKGDILYQTVRPYQKNNYFFNKLETDYVASTGYAQIRTKEISNFIYQYLHTSYFVNKVLVRCTGTSYPAINSTDLSKIKINIPALPEQQKIATFLTSVDTKLEQLKKKKDLLEQYKKGMMQQIFSQKLRFKDENGGNYRDWKKKKLGEIGKTLNGLTGKTKEDFGIGKLYIQYKQIFDSSKIKIENCGLVNVSESDNQQTVQFGDVLFTTSSETPNEIGTASVLLDDVKEMYLNSFCFGFRVNKNTLYPSFAQFLFRSPSFRKKMIPLAQGSTRYNISKSSFIKLKIDLPSIAEQTQIANFLSAIDNKIEQVQTQIETTTTFKKGMLQQMFI